MDCKNAYIVLENESGYKYNYPANATIGIDGRIVAESYRPLMLEDMIDKHSYEDSPCIFALKDDIEAIINFISECQDRGDIDDINDDSDLGLAILRIQDMLDGVIYPKLIETLNHQYPIYIKELRENIRTQEDKAVKLMGDEKFYIEYPKAIDNVANIKPTHIPDPKIDVPDHEED